MRRALLWFKTDLRLQDNETLVRAIAENDEIIPVYCFEDAQFAITPFGTQKTGYFRTKFLLESLTDLQKRLKAIAANLVITHGKPQIALAEIATKYNAQKVYCQQEEAYDELNSMALVETHLKAINCQLISVGTSTLFHQQDLPYTIQDIPDMFTSFRIRVEKDSTVRPAFAKPTTINCPVQEVSAIPTFLQLGVTELKQDKRSAFPFTGGETSGLERLNSYLFDTSLIATYKETRNGLVGENYSSKFSAWLSNGCLSARTIYWEIKKFEKEIKANDSTYWLIFELLWRDYFKWMMLKYGRLLFLQNGIKKTAPMNRKHDQDLFEKWKHGQTGYDFVDANMIELKLTGFMSNRGRQNVGSFLCNNLQLDWRYGAAYFEQQLVDYDASSNWGNWAYLAGVGNDPRANREFNIDKQADQYDHDKKYRNLWLINKDNPTSF